MKSEAGFMSPSVDGVVAGMRALLDGQGLEIMAGLDHQVIYYEFKISNLTSFK